MSRVRTVSTTRQLATLIGIAVLLGGGIFVLSTRISHAGESCQGLDTAVQNNLNFIAGQQKNPDAQSAARIANRQAVVDQIQQRRQAAGCTGSGAGNAGSNANAGNANAGNANAGNAAGSGSTGNNANSGNAAGNGNVVCPGSTVTLSGESGAPAASSNQFPIGTMLRVTNLDNNKSTTVPVTSTSGSCILLNNAAFEQVREPGKFLIRRAVIQKVG
jgi:hypothetical protein